MILRRNWKKLHQSTQCLWKAVLNEECCPALYQVSWKEAESQLGLFQQALWRQQECAAEYVVLWSKALYPKEAAAIRAPHHALTLAGHRCKTLPGAPALFVRAVQAGLENYLYFTTSDWTTTNNPWRKTFQNNLKEMPRSQLYNKPFSKYWKLSS